MRKLAFLLVATLVMNLTAPAVTTYALPKEVAVESTQESVVQEAAEVCNDFESMSLSENIVLNNETFENQIAEDIQEESKTVVLQELNSVSQKEEEIAAQCAAYAARFNETYGGVHINPLYADVISEDEVTSESDIIESTADARVKNLTTHEAVVSYLREQMAARENTISFSMPFELITNDNILVDLFKQAMVHTEECSGQEGDSLYWSYKKMKVNAQSSGSSLVITYTVEYYTTAQQEEALTEKVNQIMADFNFSSNTSEYDKVKAIHDYICDNVDYDYNYEKYSAYDALCTGTAVCQGYAIAFYRLCKEAELSVRVVAGIGAGGAHAWNIVRIDDVYYNIDCTWDGQDPETRFDWFLLNEIDFVSHTRDAEYSTDEFYGEYPMAEFSYGKTSLSTLDMTNYNYSFNTIEETTVSSAANDKPKLLIFFATTCYNSKATIKDLVSYDLGGVDIYAIEGNKNSKEAVQEFKEAYGDDSIAFCYDTGSVNNRALWAYARAAGYNDSITYPLICYIDGNNKLQYVTSGISSGKQISNYLKLTCGYEEQYREYTVTYHLDGGNNHADNPVTFNAITNTITLKDASKTGYAFYGWYTEPEFVNRVTKIEKGTRKDITLYAKFVKELELTIPEKTTYVVGEKIDLAGGSVVHNASGKSANISSSMISGFDTANEGICTVTVTYEKCKTTFDILVIKAPQKDAEYGQTLEIVTLPQYEYGTFTWNEKNTVLNQAGENIYPLTFQPTDTRFSTRNDIEGKVAVYRSIWDEGITHEIIKNVDFVYNGYPHKPEIVVYADGKPLTDEDYSIRYEENINAGLGYYWIEGKNYYTGSGCKSFTIEKADLTITAKDVFLAQGSEMPTIWEYEIKGLVKEDALVTEPTFKTTATDTQTAGRYEIVLENEAKATDNYNEDITYVNGELQIAEEKVGYSVSFDLQGRGSAIEEYFGIKAGNVIEEPDAPIAEGYEFSGWYKDANYKNVWNFATDTVQSDTILYAKWIEVKNGFRVNEIKDVVYNGKKLQPSVEVYDGETLLKAKKDYKITYHNNINVNPTPAGDVFDESLPYITITGKGNYTDSIKLNFNIVPAIIGDGTQTPAAGVTLSYTDQLTVNSKKAVNPLKSVKQGKTLKKDMDYTVSLVADNVKDANGETVTGEMEGGVIPAGYSGTFELKITGKGNYTGSITKTVFAADKTYLLKNAKITLGKNLKTIDFDTYKNQWKSQLPAAYYDAATKKYYAVENGSVNYEKEVNSKDVFVVKYGNTSLIYQKDFEVEYQNDNQTGKATLIIKGKRNYYGSKIVTYTLKGKAFNAKMVNIKGIQPMTYTGKPITQNGVQVLYKDGSPEGLLLDYGKDYTISYTKHINRGTATMTFTTKGDSGYTGSIKKTFKINVADIKTVQQVDMDNITLPYTKNGVKPVDEIKLVNEKGISLVYGKDYTLAYENNKKVADKTDEEAPTIIVKGKGNYGGEPLRIPFTIKKAVLSSEDFKIEVKEMAYNAKKAAEYQYKPAVKIYDGSKALSVNKDYEIEYKNNTQEAYQAYLETLNPELKPKVVITQVDDSNYKIVEAIEEELPIYQTKFTGKNIYVLCESSEYTGEQVSTTIAVYYTEDKNIMKQAKKLTDKDAIEALGLKKLNEGSDYTVSYGKNIVAGKNKGTVTIKGNAPLCGGSVNVKFTIDNKKLTW